MELRPPRREDAPAIVEVSHRWGYTEETVGDIETWFTVTSNDMERNARVAVADGCVVGYADVGDASSGGKILWLDVRAEGDAAPLLLDFVEERGRALAAEGAPMKAWSPEENSEWRRLLESRGYALGGYSFRMWIDLEGNLPEPEWPEGIVVRTYRRDEDEQAVYEAHQAAFAEEPDFSRDPLEDWVQWSYREPFEPELWFLALDGEEIAGVCLGRPERGGNADLGWINILGVRKSWRGRGLGHALLRNSFRAFQKRGKARAGLGVDGRNPTAIRLYERAGMRPEHTIVWYEKST